VDLFEEIVKMRRAGRRAALATIVHTNGSIPSYESSRMLVREDGSIAGTIGGGCVEAEVWAAAREVMQKESPRKMVFNLGVFIRRRACFDGRGEGGQCGRLRHWSGG